MHEPELPDVQAGFRKGRRNQRSNCQHSLDHREIKEIPGKTPTSVSLTMLKPLTNWKILHEMGIPDHLTSADL